MFFHRAAAPVYPHQHLGPLQHGRLETVEEVAVVASQHGDPSEIQGNGRAAAALSAYGDFVINHAMQEYAPGRACHPYDYVFDGSDASYPDINNWALVMADGLAYAYKYTGHARFLDAAARFYATGTIDPRWEGDPPVYIDTKGLVNALNWGLVYMNQSAR